MGTMWAGVNRNLQLDVGGNTEISWLDEARGLLLCTLEREGGAGNLGGSAEGESMVAVIDAVVMIDVVVVIDAVVVIRRCFWSTADTDNSLLMGSPLCDCKCSQKPEANARWLRAGAADPTARVQSSFGTSAQYRFKLVLRRSSMARREHLFSLFSLFSRERHLRDLITNQQQLYER